jgi:hypothetical protein
MLGGSLVLDGRREDGSWYIVCLLSQSLSCRMLYKITILKVYLIDSFRDSRMAALSCEMSCLQKLSRCLCIELRHLDIE